MYINIFIYIDLLYILTPVSFLLKGPETTSLRSIYLPLELTVSSMCGFLLCNFANISCIANISCMNILRYNEFSKYIKNVNIEK